MEKSPWVTQPTVTREQWEATLGRGSGHSPRTRSEEDSEKDLGSLDALVSKSEAKMRSAFLPSGLSGVTEGVAAFLGSFFLRLILLLKWSLCGGSWGPPVPCRFPNAFRSSGAGTHNMAWYSGLPFDGSDTCTHTRLIACADRNDVTASQLIGGSLPTRHGLWPLDVVGLHQAESSFKAFLFLGSKKKKKIV